MKRTARMFPNEQLRRERQRRGWSREYVAEQIGIADSKTIGRWERGVAFPSSYFLQKLCTLFGMSAQYLGLYQEESADAPASRQQLTSNVFFCSAPLLYDPTMPLSLTEIGGLVGQDELLESLKQRLCSGEHLPALNGLPEMGKTALAIELVHDCDVKGYFSDGVLWVELGPRPDVVVRFFSF